MDWQQMVEVKEGEPFQTNWGSVPVPLLFILNVNPLSKIMYKHDIAHWMKSNYFKLKPDKTDSLLFGTKLQQTNWSNTSPQNYSIMK